jgi:hypothetical protein
MAIDLVTAMVLQRVTELEPQMETVMAVLLDVVTVFESVPQLVRCGKEK